MNKCDMDFMTLYELISYEIDNKNARELALEKLKIIKIESNNEYLRARELYLENENLKKDINKLLNDKPTWRSLMDERNHLRGLWLKAYDVLKKHDLLKEVLDNKIEVEKNV